MSNEKDKINVDVAAKEIANELIRKLNLSRRSNSAAKDMKECGGSVRYKCSDKECDGSQFTCQPAKEFECTKFKG